MAIAIIILTLSSPLGLNGPARAQILSGGISNVVDVVGDRIGIGSDTINRLLGRFLREQLSNINPALNDLLSVAGDVFGFDVDNLLDGEGFFLETGLNPRVLDTILDVARDAIAGDLDGILNTGLGILRDIFGRGRNGEDLSVDPATGQRSPDILCAYAGCANNTDRVTQAIYEEATGPLGIPNPLAVKGGILGSAGRDGPIADVFARNPVPNAITIGASRNAQIVDALTQTKLSAAGQERIMNSSEQLSQILEGIGATAEEAIAAPTTQATLKAQTRLLAQSSVFNAAIAGDALESQIDRKLTQGLLVDISHNTTAQRRSTLVQSAALASAAERAMESNALW